MPSDPGDLNLHGVGPVKLWTFKASRPQALGCAGHGILKTRHPEQQSKSPIVTPPTAEFWNERWDRGEIGFHEAAPHKSLDAHWHTLAVPNDATVLVPLCGKSNDMHWLAGRGHRVIGVELVRKAVVDFFAEAGLNPEISSAGAFDVFRSGPFTLLCGDIFDMSPAYTVDASAIYDRASLVAVAPEQQKPFGDKLVELTATGTRGLLVSLHYDPEEMNGPPFSTPPQAVLDAVGGAFAIEQVTSESVLDGNASLRKRGLTDLTETCYMLQRN